MKPLFPPPAEFTAERHAVDFLCKFFSAQGVQFAREWRTDAGRIDFVLLDGDRPAIGVEVKKGLRGCSNLKEFTDPFEQAAAYAASLQVPVMLAPIIVRDASPRHVGHGGTPIDAYKTISIFAGRVNVGGLFFDPRGEWAMMMRGVPIWSSRGQSNPDAMRFVTSTNSKKTRASA